ncbi:MAG: molybdopterin-dependent oxidoreductase, partial [Nocardioidaceae bacterium]|nr:molybdopterin-dependent oxidoreductase [Nocardioidaceae bacterium]
VDLPRPAAAQAALEAADFVVSLEVRQSAVTRVADVVFPVAPVAEKAGMYVDWEGRVRPFEKVLKEAGALPDLRVLAGIADEMGVDLGFKTVEQTRAEMQELGAWDGARAPFAPDLSGPVGAGAPERADNSAVLATWKLLIDDGRMLDGDEYLKATGRRPVALVSQATYDALGSSTGRVRLTAAHHEVTLPVAVADLPDGVVWTPTTSAFAPPAGADVRITASEGAHV